MPNFGAMTPEHVIYIPLVIALGFFLGWLSGASAVRSEIERQKRRMKE